MLDVELKFDNLNITCTITGDNNFNGEALGIKPRNTILKFSGILTSTNLDKTVSFQYNLGDECSILFFDSNGYLIDKLNSNTSCDFIENGGGSGTFQ